MIGQIEITAGEWCRAQAVIQDLGQQYGMTVPAARAALQQLIDTAWARAWTPGNLQEQIRWQQLFPVDRQPTPEEFIITIARKQTAGRDVPPLL